MDMGDRLCAESTTLAVVTNSTESRGKRYFKTMRLT
jgi:hypothetical protein